MHVIFADMQFQGLYRSLPAAKRLVTELNALPVSYHQAPHVMDIEDVVEGESCWSRAYLRMLD